MKLREGNVSTPVCQSFCSRGVPLGPRGVHPPGHTTPPLVTHTPGHTPRNPPGRPLLRVNKRAVRILLECFLVVNINVIPFSRLNIFH